MPQDLVSISELHKARNMLRGLVDANQRLKKFSGGIRCYPLDKIEECYHELNRLIIHAEKTLRDLEREKNTKVSKS